MFYVLFGRNLDFPYPPEAPVPPHVLCFVCKDFGRKLLFCLEGIWTGTPPTIGAPTRSIFCLEGFWKETIVLFRRNLHRYPLPPTAPCCCCSLARLGIPTSVAP
jgi:hypothetical protein